LKPKDNKGFILEP